jgi:hypothetical protein
MVEALNSDFSDAIFFGYEVMKNVWVGWLIGIGVGNTWERSGKELLYNDVW